MVDRLRIRIDTPSDVLPTGRGFYQIEEDALFVPIGAQPNDKKCFSFIESETVRLDTDKRGRLLFVEVNRSRNLWTVTPNLRIPVYAEPADIRWLDFREQFAPPALLTNPDRSILCVRFSDATANAVYALATNVLLQVASPDLPTALWVTDLVDDVAGRQIALFRQSVR